MSIVSQKKNGAESNWKFQHRIQLTHANVYQTRVWWPHAHELCVSNEIPLNVLCTHYTLDTRFFPRLVSFFCSIQSMNGAQFYLEFISQLENASRVWFFSDGDDSNIIIKCCYTRFFSTACMCILNKKNSWDIERSDVSCVRENKSQPSDAKEWISKGKSVVANVR